MKSIIRVLLIFCCLHLGFAQNDSIKSQTKQPFILKLLDNKENQKVGHWSIGAYRPFFNGNDFLSKTFEPDLGFYFNFSFFIYKQFQIGYKYNYNHLSVNNNTVSGNLRSSRLIENIFYFGYEFVPSKNLRFGIEYSPFAAFRLNNKAGGSINFKDTGSGHYLNITANYRIAEPLYVFMSYGFNSITTDIRLPAELEDTFRNLDYNHFSFGFKIYFGKQDLINSFINP